MAFRSTGGDFCALANKAGLLGGVVPFCVSLIVRRLWCLIGDVRYLPLIA